MRPFFQAILAILLIPSFSFSQKNKIDSLQIAINKHIKKDSIRINLLNKQAYLLRNSNVDQMRKNVEEALQISETLNYGKGKADSHKNLGNYFQKKSDYKKAIEELNLAVEIYKKDKDSVGIARCYNNFGLAYKSLGNTKLALEYYNKAIEISEKNKENATLTAAYVNAGNIHRSLGNMSKALDFSMKALQLSEQLKDSTIIGASTSNIALIYINLADYSKALEYCKKALTIKQKIKNIAGVATEYHNISDIYIKQKKYSEALKFINLSLQIKEKNEDKGGMASDFSMLGNIYMAQKDFEKSLNYHQKSLSLSVEIKKKSTEAENRAEIAKIYFLQKKYNQACAFAQDAYKQSKELGEIRIIKNSSETLSECYANLSRYKEAYYYHIIYKNMNDSMLNEENIKKITATELNLTYEKEKQTRELEEQKKEAVFTEKLKRETLVRNSFLAGFFLMILLAFFIYRSYRIQKSTTQKIKEQKELIEKSHKQIKASINYAQKIQSAVLPNKETIEKLLPEHFILFKPRDVVSGDFYFVKQINHHLLIAAADCTGHGVPGAFMSMLGITILNEIVKDSKFNSPANILEELRHQIKQSLKQTGQDGEQQDGMDIAFCTINLETYKLEFAGANNPFWLLKKQKNNESSDFIQFTEIKADKQPIGIYPKEKPFTNKEIQLEKGDQIYIFSDGYASQFGGENGEKLKTKRMQEIITQHSDKSMTEQKEILEQKLLKWRGNKWEQVDDILIIGIKV